MQPTKLSIAAVGAFAAFAVLHAAGGGGMPLAAAAAPVTAAVALPLAVCLAVRTIAAVWRGPVLVGFPRSEATACEGDDCERVRAAAQLRGSLGGAGHVHRARLALPAAAWFSAAFVTGMALEHPKAPLGWASVVVAVTLGACLILPARPFWYREARDGAVLVHPPEACARLLRERAGAGDELCGREANGGTGGGRRSLRPQSTDVRPGDLPSPPA